MVAWLLDKALLILDEVSHIRKKELLSLLSLTDEELARWRDITRKMTVCFHQEYILSQFEGYEKLKELDWETYRQKYRNIQRLDLILKAEGDSADNYKVSKQADVVMLFYMLSHQEVITTLKRMGYPFSRDLILENIRYYLRRTSHGSTLSLVVFSNVFYDFDPEEAWEMYKEFILSDICDIQMGTVTEGIHVAQMAGSISMLFYKLCGIDTTKKCVRITPRLPQELSGLSIRFQFQQHWISLDVDHTKLRVQAEDKEGKVSINIHDTMYHLLPGSAIEVNYAKQEAHT